MSFEQEERKLDKQKLYSAEKKADALAKLEANGGNVYLTARQTGISEASISRWRKAKEQHESSATPIESVNDAPLDEQLEQLALQMVAVMPEKVEEASLQELARALTIVLDRMNQARTGKERVSHAREKLAEILEKYAVPESASGTAETTDGL